MPHPAFRTTWFHTRHMISESEATYVPLYLPHLYQKPRRSLSGNPSPSPRVLRSAITTQDLFTMELAFTSYPHQRVQLYYERLEFKLLFSIGSNTTINIVKIRKTPWDIQDVVSKQIKTWSGALLKDGVCNKSSRSLISSS